jgi:hypothetical protein
MHDSIGDGPADSKIEMREDICIPAIGAQGTPKYAIWPVAFPAQVGSCFNASGNSPDVEAILC